MEYLYLNSATKIAEDFQTHKLFWEKSKTDDDDDNDDEDVDDNDNDDDDDDL